VHSLTPPFTGLQHVTPARTTISMYIPETRSPRGPSDRNGKITARITNSIVERFPARRSAPRSSRSRARPLGPRPPPRRVATRLFFGTEVSRQNACAAERGTRAKTPVRCAASCRLPQPCRRCVRGPVLTAVGGAAADRVCMLHVHPFRRQPHRVRGFCAVSLRWLPLSH